MKSTFSFLLIASFLILSGCSSGNQKDGNADDSVPNETIIAHNVTPYFDSCGVQGSIAIYDVNNNKWIISDTAGINLETQPASTFKIINLLIALETGTIRDENEIIRWVGDTDTVKYGFRPEIYHDMSAKDAFEISAGWAYIELAKKIGKERYQQFLSKSNYGNGDLSQTDPDFWNFGKFAISPINQVEFLHSLYKGTLPFSKKNMEIVKNVMLSEQTDDYTIRAKTGWTRENNINTGWWVGYIETKKGTYIFATRLLQDRKMNRADFGSCRKDITKKVFKDLGILK